MGKSLRLSEKWFRRGLWLVAFVFASFLSGLGGTLVGDLPKVEQRQTLDGFTDPVATPRLRAHGGSGGPEERLLPALRHGPE